MKKKITAMFLALMMIVSAVGCGQKQNGESGSESAKSTKKAAESTSEKKGDIDTSQEVQLKMILLGDKPADFDVVYEKVNELMKKKINATLEVEFYGWGDWSQKYPLAFASGEDFDLIYTSSWAYYPQQVEKGGFLELTDELLSTYAPESYTRVTKDQWENTKINGKVYMIPYGRKVANNSQMVLIRGDLREKYNIPEVKDLESYKNFLLEIAEKEDSVLAYNAGGSDGAMYVCSLFSSQQYGIGGVGLFGIYATGICLDIPATTESGIPQYLDVLEDERIMGAYKLMKEFREAGVWSQSALSNQTFPLAAFENGTSASMPQGAGNTALTYEKLNALHPEWKLEIAEIDYATDDIWINPSTADGMAVHANAKNPERALMALDLLRYDKEINDLTTLGIEGVHWEAVGDTQYRSLEKSVDFPPDGACPWGWRTELFRDSADCPQIVLDYQKRVQEEGKIAPALLFNFDSEPVSAEFAACSAIAAEYAPILRSGFAEDVEGTWKEYRDKLNSVGFEKVLEEYKKQLEEFLTSYGK